MFGHMDQKKPESIDFCAFLKVQNLNVLANIHIKTKKRKPKPTKQTNPKPNNNLKTKTLWSKIIHFFKKWALEKDRCRFYF